MKFLQKIVLLLLIFFVSPTHSSGFALGTLVKTPNGYCPIEQIAIGDLVVGVDTTHSCFATKPVIGVVHIRVPKYRAIQCDDVTIITDKKQKFYINNAWIRAAKIQPGTCFSTSSPNCIVCNNVQTNKCVELYDLVVQDVHTFCVTEKDIIAHNFVISIGLAWGAGVEIVYSIGVALIPAIAAISEWFSEKQKDKQFPVLPPSDISKSGGGNVPGPPDPDNGKNRIINTVTKTAFFKSVAKAYEYWKNGMYKRKNRTKGICKAEYLQWDYRHGDVEAYSHGKEHLGSINPHTLQLYKGPAYGREFPE